MRPAKKEGRKEGVSPEKKNLANPIFTFLSSFFFLLALLCGLGMGLLLLCLLNDFEINLIVT